jgi:hypothetical protein
MSANEDISDDSMMSVEEEVSDESQLVGDNVNAGADNSEDEHRDDEQNDEDNEGDNSEDITREATPSKRQVRHQTLHGDALPLDDRLSIAGQNYTTTADITPLLERYNKLLAVHGVQKPAEWKDTKLRRSLANFLLAHEATMAHCKSRPDVLENFEVVHEPKAGEKMVFRYTGISLEQLQFLAEKAVSTSVSATDDFRRLVQLVTKTTTPSADYQETILDYDVEFFIDEGEAIMNLIVLRDSQSHPYFQEEFGEHTEIFCALARMRLINAIEKGLVNQEWNIHHFVVRGADKKYLSMKDDMAGLSDLLSAAGI